MTQPTPKNDPLARFYNSLADLVPATTNVLGTWDEHDLYWLIDKAINVVKQNHPRFLCQAGCSSCCYGDNLPLVTSNEWRVVYQELYSLPEATRRLIVKQTKEMWGPILHMILPGKAGYRDETGQMRVLPKETGGATHCPLLAYGNCSVYATRPLTCRTFGYFAIDQGSNSRPYMCQAAVGHMDDTFPDISLPMLNPYRSRIMQLEGEKPVFAMLPLWVAAHIEAGDLSQICNLDPDWDAVVKRFQAPPPPRPPARPPTSF